MDDQNKKQIQLEKLNGTILLLATLFFYDILWRFKFKETSKGELIEAQDEDSHFHLIQDKIVGKYLEDWPDDIREDYRRLVDGLPSEKSQDLFAEINYFLIFYLAKSSMPHLISDLERKQLLDSLFIEVFSDRKFWSEKYPEPDAFKRYEETKKLGGPVDEFANRICRIYGFDDPLISAGLFVRIGLQLKYLAPVFLKDIFPDKEIGI